MSIAVSKMILLVALSAIGMYAADNSLGTWKRNIAKSSHDQGNPPSNPIVELITVREAVAGGVKATSKGKRKDGSTVGATIVFNTTERLLPYRGPG